MGQTVIAGHDGITRHLPAVIAEPVAHGAGHGIIGAEHCLRRLVAALHHFGHGPIGGISPQIAVKDAIFFKRQTMIRQHLAIAGDALFRYHITLAVARHVTGIGHAMMGEHMIQQRAIGVFIITGNREAAFPLAVDNNHGFTGSLCPGDDRLYDLFVEEALLVDQQRIHHGELDGIIHETGAFVVFILVIKIHKAVVDDQLHARFLQGVVQMIHQIGTADIIGFGYAKADDRLTVDHLFTTP